MTNKYPLANYNKEHMARAAGKALPISTKQTIEICNFIRHKNLAKAKELLNKVIKKKTAIPFKRFNKDMGHKTKIGPGRYPISASNEIVKLLESVEANAQFKGLNTSNLVITHICANRASTQWRYGRQRRRQAKRTNLEIVVEEKAKEEKQSKKEKQKDKTTTTNKEETKTQKSTKPPKKQENDKK